MKVKYTAEQLLAMVDAGKPKKKRIENNKNVLRYIEEAGLESGMVLVPTYVIFWHYRTKWPCDRHYKANKTVFFRTFNKRFPEHRKCAQRYYLLKEGLIEITDEVLAEARTYDKTFWAKKKTDRKKESEQETAPAQV